MSHDSQSVLFGCSMGTRNTCCLNNLWTATDDAWMVYGQPQNTATEDGHRSMDVLCPPGHVVLVFYGHPQNMIYGCSMSIRRTCSTVHGMIYGCSMVLSTCWVDVLWTCREHVLRSIAHDLWMSDGPENMLYGWSMNIHRTCSTVHRTCSMAIEHVLWPSNMFCSSQSMFYGHTKCCMHHRT